MISGCIVGIMLVLYLLGILMIMLGECFGVIDELII